MDRSAEARRMIIAALRDLKAGIISPAEALDVEAVAAAILRRP